MYNKIIQRSREIIASDGIGNFSIEALSKSMNVNRRVITKEYNNKPTILATIIIDRLRYRYNYSINIINDKQLCLYEKIAVYYVLCIVTTLIAPHESATHFTLHNEKILPKISSLTREELTNMYSLHYNFIDRILYNEKITYLNNCKLKIAKTKLNALECGLVLQNLNAITPGSKNTIEEIITIISEETSQLFVISHNKINKIKLQEWLNNFSVSNPKWASDYPCHFIVKQI